MNIYINIYIVNILHPLKLVIYHYIGTVTVVHL